MRISLTYKKKFVEFVEFDMLIEDKKEDLVYKLIAEKLKFKPSCSYRGHSLNVNLPFEIEGNYAVYAIDTMSDSQIDSMQEIVGDILASVTNDGRRMYAIDWQHSTFLFSPQNKKEQESFWKEDSRYMGGGYNAYFPSFYPDGDYYFFIDEFWEFGYLGHPWRQEVWVFGDELIRKIDDACFELGWYKIK